MESKKTARYADIFAALGSEPRLEIIRLLFAAYPEGLTVGEIQAQLHIPNSTLSHHLEKLRIEGLVNSRRDKQFLWYSANAQTMEDLLSFLYNGCKQPEVANSLQQQANAPVNVPSLDQGFMFDKFFGSIFGKLFSSASEMFFGGLLKYTDNAIQAIELARNESRRLGHDYVGTEQILLGLMGESSGIAAQVLNSMGVNFNNIQVEIEKKIGRGKGFTSKRIPFTPRAKQVLEFSAQEALQLGQNYVGSEHLLLGILREGEGLAIQILSNLGVDVQNLEQRIRNYEC